MKEHMSKYSICVPRIDELIRWWDNDEYYECVVLRVIYELDRNNNFESVSVMCSI